MEKKEFIELLNNFEKKTKLFDNRFSKKYDNSDDYWVYNRPAIDCIEPEINLTKEYIVEFIQLDFNNTNTIIEYTYDEFITKYNLNK